MTARRWRPDSLALLTVVSALVTACVCFAPLHQRAMIESLSAQLLSETTAIEAGLRLDAVSTTTDASGVTVTVLVDRAELERVAPVAISRHLSGPLASIRVPVTADSPDGVPSTGTLLWRADACDHLELTSGSCPDVAREIVVSDDDAELFGWGVGTRIRSLEDIAGMITAIESGYIRLRVVGTYRQRDLAWWDGETLTGSSGTAADPRSSQVQHDAFVTAEDTMSGPTRVRWADAAHRLDWRADTTSLDSREVRDLGTRISTLGAGGPYPYAAQSSSDLPELADELDRADDQASLIVPLLIAQVGLVGWVILTIAVQAAATQRRPRLAVARLRGHSPRRSGWLLTRELLPPALVGVPLGMLLALPLSIASRRWVLPPGEPAPLPPAFGVAAVIAALVVTATVVGVAQTTARTPLVELLLRSPVRRPLPRLGLIAVVVVSLAVALTASVLSGGLSGAVGLATPVVLALASGLVLAGLLPVAAGRLGGRLLGRGRVRSGTGLLHLARRPASSQVAALLTVGVALLVFAVDTHGTAERNRELAARQELGAAARLSLDETRVRAVRATLDRIDPRHRLATPVTVHGSPAAGTTVGVVPEEISRIGYLGDASRTAADAARLGPPDVEPVLLRGESLEMSVRWDATGRAARPPLQLALQLTPTGGPATLVPLGGVQAGPTQRLEADIPCARGCILTDISVRRVPPLTSYSTVSLLGPSVDGTPVDLGGTDDWLLDAEGAAGFLAVSRVSGRRLDVDVQNYSAVDLRARHVLAPPVLPGLPTHPSGAPITAVQALGGDFHPITAVGPARDVPGLGPDTVVVDLDTLLLRGELPAGEARLDVLVADPARLDEVVEALQGDGLAVDRARTLDDVERQLAASVPTWGLQLALLVGATGLLLSALALVLVAASSHRARATDLAALGLLGAGPRHLAAVARWELVPVTVLAALVGGLCGTVSARLVLDSVPLFAEAPAVVTLDLSVPWPTVLLTTLTALVGLCLVSLATARVTRRAATPDLVRSPV